MRKIIFANNPDTDTFRLVHGEGDNLSGLIVDILQVMGRLENQSAQPYPMVLLAHSAYHVRAAAHHRRHSHHHRQAWLLWASCRCSPCHEPPQRIEDAEEEEALDKPHMGNLKLPAHKAEQASHGDERHTEAQQLPPDELLEALAVVAQRHEIARYEEVKSF